METQKVNIADQEKPVSVVIEESKRLVNKADEQSLAPTTTHQEDITKASQRDINLIWERTQALIAKLVVGSTMLAGLILLIGRTFFGVKDLEVPIVFAFAFGTVIGFYFSRTNHQNVGGIGTGKQEGR